MTGAEFNASNTNLKIVKTELKPSGEAVQLVRPIAQGNKTSDQIVDELVNKFSYKTSEVRSNENELSTVQQAFGSNLADELIKTYEGSNLVSDSQQDLVGEKYLAEQIRLIQEQQKNTSFLDKWSHLLYEGERDYKSSAQRATAALSENAAASNSVSNEFHESNSFFSLPTTQQQIAQSFQEQLRLSNSRNSVAASGSNQQRASAQSQFNVASALAASQSRSLSEARLQQQQQLQQQLLQQQLAFSAGLEGSVSHSFPTQSLGSQQSVQVAPLSQQSHFSNRVVAEGPSASVTASSGLVNSQSAASGRILDSAELKLQTQQEEILAYAQAQALAVQQQQFQSQNSGSMSQQQQQILTPQLSQSRQSANSSRRSANVASASSGPVSSASGSAQVNASSAAAVSAAAAAAAASAASQSEQYQQPEPNLPQLSSSNLNSVSLEAYNSPQFKALLEQLSKPITIPPEQINYPPDWPSQDKINLLAEPIYIPAPQPIVIPAPNIITVKDDQLENVFSRENLPEGALKPTVTYYPSIANDQAQFTNFGFRQLDTNLN